TAYSLSASTRFQNMLTIKRAFNFSPGASSQTESLRAYTPRVGYNPYTNVIYRDSTGTLKTVPIVNCPSAKTVNCEISDWSGKWFADDDGHGNGVMMIRGKASTAPAEIAMDYDSFSQSNVTSILLVKPAAGWSGKLTEIEYLCFYDATSWTA